MKKLLAVLSIIATAGICHADSITPRLGLIIPTIGSPYWGQKINGDMQIIDGAVAISSGATTYFIFNTHTLQSGATFFVSSGTVQNFSASNSFSLPFLSSGTLVINSLGIVTSTPTVPGGGGTPGGADTQIQVNTLGTFGGISSMTYTALTNLLNIKANTQFTSVSTMQWTNASTMTFGVGTDLQLLYVSTGSCLETDAFGNVVTSTTGACGSGSGGGGGSLIYPATSTPTFPFGVNASSFTSTGSGAGSITLQDVAGTNFVAIKASDTLTFNQTIVLPSTLAAIGQVLTVNNVDASSNVFMTFGTGVNPNAALLNSTETFTAQQTFAQTTTFSGVSTMSVTGGTVDIVAGSTISIEGALRDSTGSNGSPGQTLQPTSSGSVQWTSGGSGGGGYAMEPATVTLQAAQGIVISTMVVNSTVTINNVSSVTFNSSTVVIPVGSTLTITGVLQAGTIQDISSSHLKLYTGGNLNSELAGASFFGGTFGQNTVHGQTVGTIESGTGGDTQTPFEALTTPTAQTTNPHAAYMASVAGDGLGLNTSYFGNKSVPGRDSYFFVAGGTNASCGVSCFYPTISTAAVVINTTSGSASYGFVGINITTPTVSLDVDGSGQFTGTVSGTVKPTSKTLAQLQALAPSSAGLVYYCSDCSTDGIVVSTGTAAGSFGRVSARTTPIQ